MFKRKQFVVGGINREKENQRKNLKILIAEDDETSGFLLKMMVKTFCDTVIIVKNGADAVEACQVHLEQG